MFCTNNKIQYYQYYQLYNEGKNNSQFFYHGKNNLPTLDQNFLLIFFWIVPTPYVFHFTHNKMG